VPDKAVSGQTAPALIPAAEVPDGKGGITATAVAAVAPVETAPMIAMDTSEPPVMLGFIRLKPLETLSWLMIKVYGKFSPELLGAVLATNPGIDNPDSLEKGQSVVFPAVASRVAHRGRSYWWVRVSAWADLNGAMEAIRRYPADAPPVRILPIWEAGGGMRYHVILWEHFRTREGADAFLEGRPEIRDLSPELISQWPTDVVYYANPYAGKLR
jgi:phage tail protein X